ncbi:MAG: ABC transporter permease subunit [Kiritimatiellia bacterium]
MPLLPATGSRHPRRRLLVGLMYSLLFAGSATMVWPFLLMLAGATKSPVDAREFQAVPSFLRDDRVLYRKHVEGLFNESLTHLRVTYDCDAPNFEAVEPPAATDPLLPWWERFLHETDPPPNAYGIGYLEAPVSKVMPGALREWKAALAAQFDGDLDRLNRALGQDFVSWSAFNLDADLYIHRREKPQVNAFGRALAYFKKGRPSGERYFFMAEGFYKSEYLKQLHTRDIAVYNRAHGTSHASWAAVRLSRRAPAAGLERTEWEDFVRNLLNPLWVRVDESALPAYRAFLKAKYRDVATLNRNYGATWSSFEEAPIPPPETPSGLVLSDWESFLSGWQDPADHTIHRPALEALSVHDPMFAFHDWLAAQTDYRGPADPFPPQQALHYDFFQRNRRAIASEFSTRGYRHVVDYVGRHGRGIRNTVIYCSAAVLLSLIVNPLAAYALSRFRPRGTYRWLLFLLLTMAFPPMVTQIPAFLMLRDLGLLNTFAALLLPGLAHGYSIFLLKGFFDSLPRELYESAEIDGAGEWRMFWTLTMSLSKPILAVIALHAFTAAYTNFMFAMLTCQDERMWTLMVWLYKLQNESGDAVINASLVLAALPTLLVFLLAQRFILRGIVVPVEK